MKRFLLLFAIFVSCNTKKEISIRKIPCETVSLYNKADPSKEAYLVLYYAVDYPDSIPYSKIRYSADLIFKTIDMTRYASFVCWFLKESDELKKIRNCDTTDDHNIDSDEHKILVLFSYDRQSGEWKEIRYDE